MSHDVIGAAEAAALQELRLDWGTVWDIGWAAGQWGAARRDGTGQVISRSSAAGLALALRISHGGRR